uniref:Uncharacterized protein n=1 Tax=Anopheles culicifacies TaxID=139723 RepID=A0A182MC53_9DIPT
MPLDAKKMYGFGNKEALQPIYTRCPSASVNPKDALKELRFVLLGSYVPISKLLPRLLDPPVPTFVPFPPAVPRKVLPTSGSPGTPPTSGTGDGFCTAISCAPCCSCWCWLLLLALLLRFGSFRIPCRGFGAGTGACDGRELPMTVLLKLLLMCCGEEELSLTTDWAW